MSPPLQSIGRFIDERDDSMSKILIRDPFAELDSLFSAPLSTAFGRRRTAPRGVSSKTTTSWQLPVNVYENDEGIGIEAWSPDSPTTRSR